jgi:hypothetical protein
MNDSKNPVISFMDNLNKAEEYDKDMNDIRNSHNIKLRFLNKCEDDAKQQCMDRILGNIYKDAIPFNDEYKSAYPDEMKNDFKSFINRQAAPNDYLWYIKECIKRNNQFMNRMQEAVDELITNHYADKELNIDQVDPDDLVFKADDNMLRKIDLVGKDLGAEDISNTIKDNVKQAVMSEINRAKAEKSELKNLENELTNDNNVNTPEKVESAIEFKNFKVDKYYKPTLFESMVIYSYNNLKKDKENGVYESKNIYDALKEFKENSNSDEMLDRAFIEAVKEYTCFNILSALKMESFTPKQINEIAFSYAADM